MHDGPLICFAARCCGEDLLALIHAGRLFMPDDCANSVGRLAEGLAPGAYRELSAEEAMLVFEEPAS